MLGLALTGCSSLTTTYVINNDEIEFLSKGQTFTAPYDGTFYSQRAEKRIMEVKVRRVNLK